MRLFFALPLPERVRKELAHIQAHLKASGGPASCPDPVGLHLTLAFLGEWEEAAVPGLMAVARLATAGHPMLRLKTARLGGFPRDRAARVLWLGLDDDPGLRALAEGLRQGLRAAGMGFHDQPFRAHLTVARFKAPQDLARFGEAPEPLAFEVRELVLFQSVQTSTGSRYVPLGVVPLGSRPV